MMLTEMVMPVKLIIKEVLKKLHLYIAATTDSATATPMLSAMGVV
jgi:hypothetical protein